VMSAYFSHSVSPCLASIVLHEIINTNEIIHLYHSFQSEKISLFAQVEKLFVLLYLLLSKMFFAASSKIAFAAMVVFSFALSEVLATAKASEGHNMNDPTIDGVHADVQLEEDLAF
jgi:hypothetical protein